MIGTLGATGYWGVTVEGYLYGAGGTYTVLVPRGTCEAGGYDNRL